MSSDDGGQLRKEEETATVSETEAMPVPAYPAGGGVGDGRGDETQTGNSPRRYGDATVRRSFHENATPLLDAEGSAEDIPGDHFRSTVVVEWCRPVACFDFLYRNSSNVEKHPAQSCVGGVFLEFELAYQVDGHPMVSRFLFPPGKVKGNFGVDASPAIEPRRRSTGKNGGFIETYDTALGFQRAFPKLVFPKHARRNGDEGW